MELNSAAYIKALIAESEHPDILYPLISCESQFENRSEIDSNGKMSRGILQFQDGTWDEFSRLSGIVGSPTNATTAIAMADWAIDNGFLYRWSCAKIEKLVP